MKRKKRVITISFILASVLMAGLLLFRSGERNPDLEKKTAAGATQKTIPMAKISEQTARSIANTKTSNQRVFKLDPAMISTKSRIKDTLKTSIQLNVPEEDKISIDGQTYIILDQYSAVGNEVYTPDMGPIIKKYNHMVIFEKNINSPNMDKELAVVQNLNNGMMGVITGYLVLVPKSSNSIEHILNNYPLEVSYQAKQINTYYLKYEGKEDIFEMADELMKSNSVKRVTVEVIEKSKRAF